MVPHNLLREGHPSLFAIVPQSIFRPVRNTFAPCRNRYRRWIDFVGKSSVLEPGPARIFGGTCLFCAWLDNRPMQKHGLSVRVRTLPTSLALGACAALLAACSPSLNWRNVPVEEAQLTVSLPCKPDHGKRTVELGPNKTELSMVGCEAGGALFAVSYMELRDPSLIGSTLTLWHDAVRAQLHLPKQAPGAQPEERSFVRKGALNVPQSVRMQTIGQKPGGAKVNVDGVWFARLRGGSVQLVHAVVYSDKRDDAVADGFLESITLQ